MLSRTHAAPPCHANRYTRFVGPPLAHTVSRQSRPVRARPSHAAGSGTRHTTRARTGSMRIRLFCPYPSLVTITDPSESVTRFKGSVPTGTTRPAGRIRQPLGRSVDPSGNEPGTRRVARSAAPAMAGSASRERLSMSRNMGARGTAGIPLALGAMTGLIFHLIPHTHWDREWYLPRAALQARFVDVMDDLIERLQANPGYRSFLLDGQTVLVEDYLRARPDREGDVRALVKTGRLQVGPWYVLADEQIPSGEGLVRNLLLGAADAERLGGRREARAAGGRAALVLSLRVDAPGRARNPRAAQAALFRRRARTRAAGRTAGRAGAACGRTRPAAAARARMARAGSLPVSRCH